MISTECVLRQTRKIINIAKDLESIKYQEHGERVFSDHEVNHAKWCIFFGALFNRCLDKAERYVSRARLLAVMREVYDRASSNDSHVDMEFYKKRFKERISSMLNSCGGSSASEPRYVLQYARGQEAVVVKAPLVPRSMHASKPQGQLPIVAVVWSIPLSTRLFACFHSCTVLE